MAVRHSLSDLRISGISDLCLLDGDTPPPFDFARDLKVSALGSAVTAPPLKRSFDTTTYWQPQGFHP